MIFCGDLVHSLNLRVIIFIWIKKVG